MQAAGSTPPYVNAQQPQLVAPQAIRKHGTTSGLPPHLQRILDEELPPSTASPVNTVKFVPTVHGGRKWKILSFSKKQ